MGLLGDALAGIRRLNDSFQAAIFQFFPGYGQFAANEVNMEFQNVPLDQSQVIAAHLKGWINREEYLLYMSLNGINESNADIALQASTQQLTLSEILTVYFRYKDKTFNNTTIDKVWFIDQLRKTGIDPNIADWIIEANRGVPTAQDIITFADRDVFDENVVNTLGLLDGKEQNIEVWEQLKERGFSETDINHYWASHWRPPSMLMGFEMFQRLFDHPDPETRFTIDKLRAFFNIHEVPPRMRKSLEAISYNTITRVDVRRFDRLGMFGTGEERREKLIRAYREIGYNPNNATVDRPSDAEAMTEFTIRMNADDERELTRSQLEKYYIDGLFDDESEPLQYLENELKDIGYPDEKATIIALHADIRKTEKEKDQNEEIIKDQYIAGIISSDAELRQALQNVGFTESEIRSKIRTITNERTKQIKKVPLGDLQKAVTLGIASITEYAKRLNDEGYTSRDQQIAVELLKLELEPTEDE